MTLAPEQEKKLLIALAALFMILVLYRMVTAEKPRTAPLTYPPGSVATSPVRSGITAATNGTGPLAVFIERRNEKFPGVVRDIFRMENPEPKPKPKPVLVSAVTPTVPPAPVKTPEEIARDLARADLSKFRFLGYLTEKDRSIFLSKDGELYIVKSGDRILKNYRVKETGKDYVVLLDTVTNVDARVELTGGAEQSPRRPTR